MDASDTIQSLSGSGGWTWGSGVVLTTGDSGDDTLNWVIMEPVGWKKWKRNTDFVGANTYNWVDSSRCRRDHHGSSR